MKTLIKHGIMGRDVYIKIRPSDENPQVMSVTRTSDVTGKEHTMEMPVTEDQLRNWLGGQLIQVVMPHLSKEQREFLISGCTPEEWAEIIKNEE